MECQDEIAQRTSPVCSRTGKERFAGGKLWTTGRRYSSRNRSDKSAPKYDKKKIVTYHKVLYNVVPYACFLLHEPAKNEKKKKKKHD